MITLQDYFWSFFKNNLRIFLYLTCIYWLLYVWLFWWVFCWPVFVEAILLHDMPVANDYTIFALSHVHVLKTNRELLKSQLPLFSKCCHLRGWRRSGANFRRYKKNQLPPFFPPTASSSSAYLLALLCCVWTHLTGIQQAVKCPSPGSWSSHGSFPLAHSCSVFIPGGLH